jgi:hypothetical protein
LNYSNDAEKITDIYSLQKNLWQWITDEDYRSIAQWILNENKLPNNLCLIDLKEIYKICLDIFDSNGLKVLSKSRFVNNFVGVLQVNNSKNSSINSGINPSIILLSRILSLFSQKANLKQGKSIYITTYPESITHYETLISSNCLRHYRILTIIPLESIDEFNYLSLFKLNRNKYNIKDKYWYHWLYHASFSPIWSQRIKDQNGYPDYMKEKIVFTNVLKEDEFYRLYGLEPDEQKKDIQEKSIMDIKKVHNWSSFYRNYKGCGLINIYEEELEELDVDGLNY